MNFWIVVCAVAVGLAAVFGVLWRQSQQASLRRLELCSEALRLLRDGEYAQAQLLMEQRRDVLPPEVTRQAIATAQTLARQTREQELARRELEDVMSSLQDAVLVVDKNERLRFLNAAALQLFDVRIEDVLGAHLLEALPSFGLESCVRLALSQGRSTMNEQSLYASARTKTETRASATTNATSSTRSSEFAENVGDSRVNDARFHDARRDVLIRVSPVRSSAGQAAGAVAIIQDLTEMRRLERVRRDFVANASHELRTPIANIRAGAETILDNPDEPKLIGRFLPQIVEESERLSRLVSDLLDLAQADASSSARRDPVDICEVAQSVVQRLQEKAQQNGVALDIEYSKEACARRVPGDFAGLEQVFFNLLDNALIYTPSGGKVSLGVELLLSESGEEIAASVRDNGLGIPAEDQERVFERFYRVDKARSRAQGGTGLGLAIVKHIVDNHGGRIKLQSAPGEGTTFTIFLPTI